MVLPLIDQGKAHCARVVLSAPRRAPRRQVDGVLLLDKPSSIGSNSALQRVKRLLNAEKAGHTGTLDPLASGLLPLCFGEATKFSSQLLNADKRYVATVRLGVTTDTGDADGNVLVERPVSVDLVQLQKAASQFQGEIHQIPPMFSALKRDGKPLYEYAREGIELPREARLIHIRELHISKYVGESFEMDVRCSKGTYIRTLAMDIGEQLGCGAHLTALRRVAIGPYAIGEALSLEVLEHEGALFTEKNLLPVDHLLQTIPTLILDLTETQRLACGQRFRPNLGSDGAELGGLIRLYSNEGLFLGLGEMDAGLLAPKRLLASSVKSTVLA
jgi:tRNA pseudouridine55 synthase